MSRAETLALARRARELWVKRGADVLHFQADRHPMSEQEMADCLVHEDGWMRVPILVDGPLLIRGYTEALYRRALGERGSHD